MFYMDEELGDDPTLPPGLTLFLAEGMVEEQDDSPCSSSPMPLDSSWLAPSKGSQCHPTYTVGAQLEVPTKPSASQSISQSRSKEGPDLVNHPC